METGNAVRSLDLWSSGEGGYHTYRIPALARTAKGTLLALCEGRRHGRGDAGQIDLLLRRSEDGGVTWDPSRVVVTQEGMTCGNPCPVVDRATGAIWLPFCKNLAEGNEDLICRGKAPRTVFLTASRDDGKTWDAPRDITGSVKDPAWTWYATGPGHGIQLRSGRLLVPCDHMVGVYFDRKADPYHSHAILSDDHGASWRVGGTVDQGTNECIAAECSDGSVYINCRNYVGNKRRAAARSRDGGATFADFGWDEVLIEPVCQAGMAATSHRAPGATLDTLVFSNPASLSRERMTVRASTDGGRSWSGGKCLHPGPAAYSDLVEEPGGGIGCLYECGTGSSYERLRYVRFDVPWVVS